MSNTPWNHNNIHGFTTGPIITPHTTSKASNSMIPTSATATSPNMEGASVPPAGNSNEAPKEKLGQNVPMGLGAMVPVHHQHHQAPLQQRPPSSASNASSMASFGSSNVIHHPTPHHHPMGGNNHHMQHHPQFHRQHPPHPQSHHVRHGEPMMGGMHPQQQRMNPPHMPPNNNNYHQQQQGLVRPHGRYPGQQGFRGGEQYGMNNMHMQQQQGHMQHGRPAGNFHNQQYHSFPPQSGMEPVSRGPSPSLPQQQQKPQMNIPPGVAVAIRRSSENGAKNGAAQENPNQTNNFQAKPHQQHPGQSPPMSHGRQDHNMGGPEQHRHHPGPAMHQRYPGQQHQHQRPQHDHMHYGGQPPMHHGMHSNPMQTDMHRYNYHQQGPPGPSFGHNNNYHGHHDNGMQNGYPRGPRDMYPHGHPQHHFQQQQHPPTNAYGGQPLHQPPPPPQRGPAHGFQLPKYNATRPPADAATVSSKTDSARPMSRSPSPPPSPPPAPSAQALLRQKLREQGAKKEKEQSTQDTSTNKKAPDSMSISGESIIKANNDDSKPMALGDRGNVGTAPASALKKPETTTKTTKQEEITADAASILLQLSVMNRSTGGSENQNPKSPPIPTSVQHSASMDDVSDAGTFLTMQTGEAPDLTSEPSSDSIDDVTSNKPASTTSMTSKSVADSDFPCAVPDRYPTRLSLPYDNAKLNTLHCFLRSELLEIFVVSKSFRKSPCHSPSSSVGRVGLRCVHCAMMRGSRRDEREDAPMAVFYPKSIAEIYRLVTSWQRCHLRKCKNVPPAVRARWQELRDTDRSRGKTHYWVTSAKQIGLMDCQSRAGGIRFAPDFDPRNLPAETKLTPSSKEAAAKAAAIAAKAQKIVSMANAAGMAVVPENTEMKNAAPTAAASTIRI